MVEPMDSLGAAELAAVVDQGSEGLAERVGGVGGEDDSPASSAQGFLVLSGR